MAKLPGEIIKDIAAGAVKEYKEAERIAKEIGGHIPERVVDDGVLSGDKPKVIDQYGIAKPTMLISVELYTQLIEQKSYAAGRIAELEKQLEELKRQREDKCEK